MKLVQKLALNKWGPGCHKPIYRVLTAPVLLLESKDFNFVLKKNINHKNSGSRAYWTIPVGTWKTRLPREMERVGPWLIRLTERKRILSSPEPETGPNIHVVFWPRH